VTTPRTTRGQTQLFGPELPSVAARPRGAARELQLIVTVKAAPNPSATHGETVCVAGLSVAEPEHGWIRLYPINFRYLQQDRQFRKHDIVHVTAAPAVNDARTESWRPDMSTLSVVRNLPTWQRRRPSIDPYVEPSMCALNRAAQTNVHARSLGLVEVRDVGGLDVDVHPGWTAEEQRKIDGYVNQLDLFGGEDRAPLEAPRFRGHYRWRCADPTCKGHRQGLIDWEFVALQRRLRTRSDSDAVAALQTRFVDELCSAANEVAFYVGNQAKRENVFSVLGVYYPKLKG
jgi:hypothetical protein